MRGARGVQYRQCVTWFGKRQWHLAHSQCQSHSPPPRSALTALELLFSRKLLAHMGHGSRPLATAAPHSAARSLHSNNLHPRRRRRRHPTATRRAVSIRLASTSLHLCPRVRVCIRAQLILFTLTAVHSVHSVTWVAAQSQSQSRRRRVSAVVSRQPSAATRHRHSSPLAIPARRTQASASASRDCNAWTYSQAPSFPFRFVSFEFESAQSSAVNRAREHCCSSEATVD